MKLKITRRFILDAIAVSGSVIGSAIVASNTGHGAIGYLLFLFSSIASVMILKETGGAKSILLINVYFTFVNVFGLVRFTFP